jgi:hypothetical protein
MMRKLTRIPFLVLLSLAGVSGQSATYEKFISQIITNKRSNLNAEQQARCLRSILHLGKLAGTTPCAAADNLAAFGEFLLSKTVYNEIDTASVEDLRFDKQMGAVANSSGATSLVSRGAVPAILGLAVENGALTQSISGTVVTFRGNPVGLLQLATSKGWTEGYYDDAPLVNTLRKFSFAIGVDQNVQRPNPKVGSSIADLAKEARRSGQQIGTVSVRFDLKNRRDSRDAANQAELRQLLQTEGAAAFAKFDFIDDLLLDPAYKEWREESVAQLNDATTQQVRPLFLQRMEKLKALIAHHHPKFLDDLQHAQQAIKAYKASSQSVFTAMEKKPLTAVEWVHQRQMLIADYSTLRLIHERKAGPGGLVFTANTALSFFTGNKGTSGRFRDWQASGQGEWVLSSTTSRFQQNAGVGAPSLGFAFLLQRLGSATPVTFAGISALAEAGNIAIGQAKLMVPIRGSGIKIPISFSVSNRTELIREKEIRGNIGLTFDLDVIAASIQGKLR